MKQNTEIISKLQKYHRLQTIQRPEYKILPYMRYSVSEDKQLQYIIWYNNCKDSNAIYYTIRICTKISVSF